MISHVDQSQDLYIDSLVKESVISIHSIFNNHSPELLQYRFLMDPRTLNVNEKNIIYVK